MSAPGIILCLFCVHFFAMSLDFPGPNMPNKLRNRVELRTYEEDMSDFSGGDSVTKKSTRNNILD
jgi:hypothetical protein